MVFPVSDSTQEDISAITFPFIKCRFAASIFNQLLIKSFILLPEIIEMAFRFLKLLVCSIFFI